MNRPSQALRTRPIAEALASHDMLGQLLARCKASEARLLAVAAWLGREGAMPERKLTLSERRERLRKLERSCLRVERQLQQSGTHPAWGFASVRGGERKKLRQRASRELDELITQARDGLDELERFIKRAR